MSLSLSKARSTTRQVEFLPSQERTSRKVLVSPTPRAVMSQSFVHPATEWAACARFTWSSSADTPIPYRLYDAVWTRALSELATLIALEGTEEVPNPAAPKVSPAVQ